MDLSLYLEKLYHIKPTIIKTNLGLTNDIYQIIINNKKYALRVTKNDISSIIGNHEFEVLKLIKKTDLDVDEVYYDPKIRLRITRWVDNYQTFHESNDKDKYIRATKLIKKLHNYKFKVSYTFDPKNIYFDFKKQIINPLFNYDKYEYLFSDFNKLNKEKVLCHNDLVSGNFLLTKDKDYLIDYEYAGMNHPYFDLMSFITENDIDDERIRSIIYHTYFDKDIDNQIQTELTLIENMQNLLWAAWANMLYDSRHDQIYLDIFNNKIDHFRKKINL